jgi:transposase
MRSSSPARYPSDLTDGQWALIEAMVPVKPGGRPAVHSRRRIVEAILYVNRTGCSRRQLPHDFPPWDTVYWYFKRWNADGTTDRIHDALRDATRDAVGRDPMASAGIVDAQSVKGADTVGAPTRGFDAGKKGFFVREQDAAVEALLLRCQEVRAEPLVVGCRPPEPRPLSVGGWASWPSRPPVAEPFPVAAGLCWHCSPSAYLVKLGGSAPVLAEDA